VVGDNLTSYPNLDFIEGKSPQELKDLLTQIRLPHKIISIYAMGTRHIAWITISRPIKKINNKGEKDGSIKE